MKTKLKNNTMFLYETKEVEVKSLTPKEANKHLDAFLDALFDVVGEDEWTEVIEYMRDYSVEACNNYKV